jgi:VWFA-related protein
MDITAWVKRPWLALTLAIAASATLALTARAVEHDAALGAVQQRPVFRSGVETVQVDVVVRDRSGQPVRGLTADDFVILDRGKPQPVVTFTAVERQDAPPSFARSFPITTRLDVASNQAAQARQIVVVVLDDLHGFRGRDDVVKRIAREVVEKMGPDAIMALLMTSGNYNVEITEDRSRVIDAIDRFKGARLVRRPMLAIDDRQGSGAGVQPPGRGGGGAVRRDSGADLQEFDANLRLYATLEQAARLFSATDGRRKAFVLVSENLAKNLEGVLQAQSAAPDAVRGSEEYMSGDLAGMNPRRPTAHHDLAVLDALASLRKSNVVTYAIDPRGEVSTQDLMLECHPALGFGSDPCIGDETKEGPSSFSSWVRLAQNGLQQLAGASGGFAVVNSSDFTSGVSRIIDDLENYYLLGFNTDDSKSGGFRRLEVQVKNGRDLQLRYRRGYEIGGKAARGPAEKDSPFDLVTSALPKANVPLRLTAAALPGSGREARVPLALEVTMPRQSLELADGTLRDQIRYTVSVVDMRGAKVKEATGYSANFVLRPRANAGTPPDAVAYQIGTVLTVPPGRYQLRASASSAKLGEGGSVYLPLEVPDFTNERIVVSGLVVGYGTGPRVPAVATVSPAQAVANRRAGAVPPITAAPGSIPGGLPFQPTLDREFLTTDEVALYFEVARKDRARAIAIDLVAIDRYGNSVPQYAQKLAPGSAGKVSVRVPLKNIGTGPFRLRVRASDGVNEAFSEVPIVIK